MLEKVQGQRDVAPTGVPVSHWEPHPHRYCPLWRKYSLHGDTPRRQWAQGWWGGGLSWGCSAQVCTCHLPCSDASWSLLLPPPHTLTPRPQQGAGCTPAVCFPLEAKPWAPRSASGSLCPAGVAGHSAALNCQAFLSRTCSLALQWSFFGETYNLPSDVHLPDPLVAWAHVLSHAGLRGLQRSV